MTGPLDGKAYRARVRLSDRDDVTLAAVGETCERVPAISLAALLASGHLEPADRAWIDLGRADERGH